MFVFFFVFIVFRVKSSAKNVKFNYASMRKQIVWEVEQEFNND